jgi:hemerythrin superfamily protein
MAQDAVTLIKNDHRLMERLFARLKTDDGDRRELVAEVEARLTAHARAEEAEVYPVIAREAAGKDDVQHGAGEHFEAERKLRKVLHLIDAPHFDLAVEEFGGLAEATRDELYEKAREADIPGRSRMNKDDLIEALREQR